MVMPAVNWFRNFSADPEEILPEARALESGKSYREKKAKPLLAQIVMVLRSLYLAYVELRGKFERLQGDYGRVRESNARLSDRLQEVKLENKTLRQVSADYERVKRVQASAVTPFYTWKTATWQAGRQSCSMHLWRRRKKRCSPP